VAFVEQPKELMDAIQFLGARRKGRESKNDIATDRHGNKRCRAATNVTEIVNVTKEIIEVVPANPSVIYVPSYPRRFMIRGIRTMPTGSSGFFRSRLRLGMFWGAAWAITAIGARKRDIDIDSNRNINRNTDRNTARAGDRMSNTVVEAPASQSRKPDQTDATKRS
jgi:hypothetical protein